MKKNMFTLINSLIAIVLFALFAGCVPEPKPKADQIIQRKQEAAMREAVAQWVVHAGGTVGNMADDDRPRDW